eukprot:15474728-Alexandrium_andersonii.AAC.1
MTCRFLPLAGWPITGGALSTLSCTTGGSDGKGGAMRRTSVRRVSFPRSPAAPAFPSRLPWP